jgi:hypothetical protein
MMPSLLQHLVIHHHYRRSPDHPPVLNDTIFGAEGHGAVTL